MEVFDLYSGRTHFPDEQTQRLAYNMGWDDARTNKPCNPPPMLDQYESDLYVEGWNDYHEVT